MKAGLRRGRAGIGCGEGRSTRTVPTAKRRGGGGGCGATGSAVSGARGMAGPAVGGSRSGGDGGWGR